MPRRSRWTGSLILVVAALALFAATASADVTVTRLTMRGADAKGRAAYFAQKHRFWGTNKYPADPAFLAEMFTLSTGKTEFVVWLPGKVDGATNEWRSPVGMPRPSNANWYQSGFYEVKFGRDANHQYKTEIGEVKAGEEQGSMTIIWHHPKARIATTLILLDGDDKLLLETELEPKAKFKSYAVKLRAYPSAYAGGYKAGMKTRDRGGLTPKRELKREAKADNMGYINARLAKDEPWVLLLDKHYDVAANRCDGPCAAAYSPKEVLRADVSVQNYSCYFTARYPAKVTTSHLIVWDFKGMSNAQAKEYMKAVTIDTPAE